MKPFKSKIIIIVGPNASGKSALAVKIAKKINGEIISADSRQIYKKLNIATGKVPGRKKGDTFIYKGVPHHGINLAPPTKQFTVAEFKEKAQTAIIKITKQGKIPMVVGGTGFWIDSLIYDYNLPPVPPNPKLRKKLEKKSAAELLKILEQTDPRRAADIEQKNPRRLIRAIEIAKTSGPTPELKKRFPYQTLWLGINPPRQALHQKIHQRLLKRLRSGMIQEARNLKKQGLPWKRFYELGLEYKFLAEYLRGRLTKKEMAAELGKAIRQYARRQIVWFKKNKQIRWIQKPREAEILVKKFIN